MSNCAPNVIAVDFTADLPRVVGAALLKAFRSGFDTKTIAEWADISESLVVALLAEAREAERARA